MDLQQQKKIVSQARRDPQMFADLYDDNYPRIYNFIVRRVTSVEIAQDITSEVFLKAFQKLWLFQWRRISFSSWLYRIAIHEISNYFRKNKYQSISLDSMLEEHNFEPADKEDPQTEMIKMQSIIEEKKDFLKIQKALTQLPLKYQTVLSLKFFEHKKIHEICEILGKKEGTVKSLLSRGMNQLKALVQ